MASQDKANFGRERERSLPTGQKGGQITQGAGSRQDNRSSGKSGQQSGGKLANDPSRSIEAEHKDRDRSGGGRY